MASATAALRHAGAPSARTDAELLAASVLGVPRGRLPLIDGFDADQCRRYRHLVRRRAAGVPVQHLTGVAGFRYVELAVGPGVFVPRPETELLVDAGRMALADVAQPVVVDLCAGSGAIGLSVAAEWPEATVFLVECDPMALDYLRRNAGAGADRTVVVAADATRASLGDDLAAASGRPVVGTVDAVLTNPPYIPAGSPLPADVAGADPDRALFAGADGLAVIGPLISTGAQLLRSEGVLVIEHDDTHGESVPNLLRADGRFTRIADHRDLAGRPRYTTAHRR